MVDAEEGIGFVLDIESADEGNANHAEESELADDERAAIQQRLISLIASRSRFRPVRLDGATDTEYA